MSVSASGPKKKLKLNKLTPAEERVIIHKGTEWPYTGEYEGNFREGTYVCKRCNAPLYKSDSKFNAHCGWPAFDQEIKRAVEKGEDHGPMLGVEIHCARCGAHLGHVYYGERFTEKNTRHCVNSISMRFIPKKKGEKDEKE